MTLQVQEIQHNPRTPRFIIAAKTGEISPGSCIDTKLEDISSASTTSMDSILRWITSVLMLAGFYTQVS